MFAYEFFYILIINKPRIENCNTKKIKTKNKKHRTDILPHIK